MLGKLFNLTSAPPAGGLSQQSPSSPQPTPESVQEDIYTRSLLFPDPQALQASHDQVFYFSTAPTVPSSVLPNAFDYDGDVDLDTRDVRVIIMQGSLGSVNPSLLFDSHPGPTVSTASERTPANTTPSQNLIQDLHRVPTSPRKASVGQPSRPLVIQPGSPQHRQGALDRRSSIQTRNYNFTENETQRAAREYREELASFSNCIFANTEVMKYKGTSTKVHIVPSESRPSEVSSSYIGDGRGSMGRSSARSSKLAHSLTSEAAHLPFSSSNTSGRQSDRKKVLVTRLFPVNLPTDGMETPNTGVSHISEDSGGFPFPYSLDEAKMKKKKPTPIQKKTPMYAVALVLQLPPSPSQTGSTAPKPVFRGSGSYNEQQDAFPSSFGSARRAGWTMVGTGFGADSAESTYSNDVEDRIDAITQHWDVIMRTLTHLQSTIATALFPMLKQADIATADPYPAALIGRTPSTHSRRGSDASQMKPPKPNAKAVTLPPNCLMQEQRISQEVYGARVRIVSGLRATRVVTGQNRWGPWREEARWFARWAGGKEQGFFFFNLLTGFLATHQEWLQALSPAWYRKRHYHQQRARSEEDTSLPSRTIVVARDKMAARRLIFLLAAFLPSNQQLPVARTHRPGTSASVAAYGHSPPSFIVPILKEESLRRKINRKAGGRRTSHGRSLSIQSQATTRSVSGIPAQLAHLSMDPHGRRSSDATLSKPSNLPIAGSDINTRKSSAATTNTIMPDPAVPHFSTVHRTETRRSYRPGSSGSMAADDLKRTLKRGHSSRASQASIDSRSQSSRWGSVISGLWSTKRRDSNSTMDFPTSQDSPLPSPIKTTTRNKNTLSEMVEEAQALESSAREQESMDDQPDTPRRSEGRGFVDSIDPKARVPDPSSAFESPVKTSINNDDGVIDVEIPFPDFLTSFETAVSSPSSSGYLSTPGLGSGLDSFEQFSRVAIDGDTPLNVAGWLQRFHPDFSLQAIPPQADLLGQVREALVAEQTPMVPAGPAPDDWPTERWVDVSTAIIADTTNFTIKRLRYKRLVKPKILGDQGVGQHPMTASSLETPALSPYEQPIKDRIDEEVLVTLDDTLIDAVEKVIALSSDTTKESSANSSRSNSKRRERRHSEISEVDPHEAPAENADFREVPRAECKTVILSALEDIVQGVVAERERDGHNNKIQVTYEREKESALRSAVRTWDDSVEMGEV